jgi:hypothetical protein
MFKRIVFFSIAIFALQVSIAKAQAIQLTLVQGDAVDVGVGFQGPWPKIVQISNLMPPAPTGSLLAEWDNVCGWNPPNGYTLYGPGIFYIVAADHLPPCADIPFNADDPGQPIGYWRYTAPDGGGGSSVITIAIETVGDSTKSGLLLQNPATRMAAYGLAQKTPISFATFHPSQKFHPSLKGVTRAMPKKHLAHSIPKPIVRRMENREVRHHAVQRPQPHHLTSAKEKNQIGKKTKKLVTPPSLHQMPQMEIKR